MHTFNLVIGGVCTKIRNIKITSDRSPSIQYTKELLKHIAAIENGTAKQSPNFSRGTK